MTNRPGVSLVRLTALMVVVLALALAPDGRAAAKVRVTSIKAGAEEGKLIVTVNLTGRIKPKVFGYGAKGPKPRLVIDFKNAKADRLPYRIKSPSPLARGIRVGRHPDKIRVVIDLKPGYVYKVEQWFRRDVHQYVVELSAE